MLGSGIKLTKRARKRVVCAYLLERGTLGFRFDRKSRQWGDPVGQGVWGRAGRRGSLKAWRHTANFCILSLRRRKPVPVHRDHMLDQRGSSSKEGAALRGIFLFSPTRLLGFQQVHQRLSNGRSWPHGGAKAPRSQQPGGDGPIEHQLSYFLS